MEETSNFGFPSSFSSFVYKPEAPALTPTLRLASGSHLRLLHLRPPSVARLYLRFIPRRLVQVAQDAREATKPSHVALQETGAEQPLV